MIYNSISIGVIIFGLIFNGLLRDSMFWTKKNIEKKFEIEFIYSRSSNQFLSEGTDCLHFRYKLL